MVAAIFLRVHFFQIFLGNCAQVCPRAELNATVQLEGSLPARAHHTLVWTGDERLVYGGTVGTHVARDTNSGALYTPF